MERPGPPDSFPTRPPPPGHTHAHNSSLSRTSPLAISHSFVSPVSEYFQPRKTRRGETEDMTTLGKRHRNNSSLRRTTSVSGLAGAAEEQGRQPTRAARGGEAAPVQRRHSGDFPVTETAAFLKACGLCNRRLGPGRDTYIYMGEVAFCSHECRQKQMNLDELKEQKCDQSGNSGTVAAA